MSIEVKLPDLGDGIESGDILEVLVREGDRVSKDQGIVEIETDKATVEVPSSQAGKVAQVHVSAGQTVSVGQVLITLEATAAESPAPAAAPPAPMAPTETSTAPPPATTTGPTATSPSSPGFLPPGWPTQSTPSAQAPAASPAPVAPAPAPTPTRVPSSNTLPGPAKVAAAGPAVRRFAREVGVDLSLVQGTGPGSRIRREDVLQVVRQASQVKRRDDEPARPTAADDLGDPLPGTPASDSWGPTSIEPLTRIRKTIATKMFQSWSTVPRVTNFDDADVTELEKIMGSNSISMTAYPPGTYLLKVQAENRTVWLKVVRSSQ